jgi:hypothetical protein
MKSYHKKILASILFVIISAVCIAQVGEPPPPETQDGPLPPGSPIDGFTAVAALIGTIYGIRKTIKNSKEH